jgi:hypothetical protein
MAIKRAVSKGFLMSKAINIVPKRQIAYDAPTKNAQSSKTMLAHHATLKPEEFTSEHKAHRKNQEKK